MIERREFLPRRYYNSDHVRVWSEWLRHHGIEPALVAFVGWIERDTDARQVRFELYLAAWVDSDGSVRDLPREVRVVQLESAPAPFPP